jgi:RNA polymerase-binding transcription factor DksA
MADSLELTVRGPLEEERSHLRAQVDAIEAAKFDDNFADSGQVAAEQGEAKTLAGNLQDQLDDVEAALSKLDDGTYGQCEKCQKAIGDARLEAMPATRFCIDHA